MSSPKTIVPHETSSDLRVTLPCSFTHEDVDLHDRLVVVTRAVLQIIQYVSLRLLRRQQPPRRSLARCTVDGVVPGAAPRSGPGSERRLRFPGPWPTSLCWLLLAHRSGQLPLPPQRRLPVERAELVSAGPLALVSVAAVDHRPRLA